MSDTWSIWNAGFVTKGQCIKVYGIDWHDCARLRERKIPSIEAYEDVESYLAAIAELAGAVLIEQGLDQKIHYGEDDIFRWVNPRTHTVSADRVVPVALLQRTRELQRILGEESPTAATSRLIVRLTADLVEMLHKAHSYTTWQVSSRTFDEVIDDVLLADEIAQLHEEGLTYKEIIKKLNLDMNRDSVKRICLKRKHLRD